MYSGPYSFWLMYKAVRARCARKQHIKKKKKKAQLLQIPDNSVGQNCKTGLIPEQQCLPGGQHVNPFQTTSFPVTSSLMHHLLCKISTCILRLFLILFRDHSHQVWVYFTGVWHSHIVLCWSVVQKPGVPAVFTRIWRWWCYSDMFIASWSICNINMCLT